MRILACTSPTLLVRMSERSRGERERGESERLRDARQFSICCHHNERREMRRGIERKRKQGGRWCRSSLARSCSRDQREGNTAARALEERERETRELECQNRQARTCTVGEGERETESVRPLSASTPLSLSLSSARVSRSSSSSWQPQRRRRSRNAISRVLSSRVESTRKAKRLVPRERERAHGSPAPLVISHPEETASSAYLPLSSPGSPDPS